MTRLEFLEAMRESARSHLECEARTMLLTELKDEIKKETNKRRTNVTLMLKKLSSVVALAVLYIVFKFRRSALHLSPVDPSLGCCNTRRTPSPCLE